MYCIYIYTGVLDILVFGLRGFSYTSLRKIINNKKNCSVYVAFTVICHVSRHKIVKVEETNPNAAKSSQQALVT